jgi:peptidoglycan/xylan/chitin deacetylase (PgdA/CDA1 family)
MTHLPVLTFHAIHEMRSPVAIDAGAFGRLMTRLAGMGWRTVSAADALAFARGERELPERRFLITFDDGYASVPATAAPVLRDLGFGAVVFLTTGLLDRPAIFPGDPVCPPERAATWAEARGLAAAGFEIGSHATNHRHLTTLGDDELAAELAESRRLLEERLSVPVRLHAYPFGSCDARVAAACARVYDGAFTTRLDYVRRGDDPRLLPRLDAHYLRFLAARGDLASLPTRAWLGIRRAGRAVRSALAREGGAP